MDKYTLEFDVSDKYTLEFDVSSQLTIDGFSTQQQNITSEIFFGYKGDRGEKGDPGITLTFNFPLQLQWIVNHNLGRRPAVEVYTSGGALVFADVLHLNTNTVQITFDEPISGFVIII